MVWLTGSALGICLLMIGGLVGVILFNGLGFFWPKPLLQVTLRDGATYLGERVGREGIPNPGNADHLLRHRVQLKVGNRDLYGQDFRWIPEDEIVDETQPEGAYLVERREYGVLIGTPTRLERAGTQVAVGPEVERHLRRVLEEAEEDRATIADSEKRLGAINQRIEGLRLEARRLERRDAPTAEQNDVADAARDQEHLYAAAREELDQLVSRASESWLTFETVDGQQKEIRALDVFRAYPANRLGVADRLALYLSRLWAFLAHEPRESNTEGGVFPAIFGTVMLVLLMSLAVVPLGVLAALYLREYAKEGPMVRTVRIAVNNLAGVPSIVFGIFGLGFFVYFVGGTIDQLFFSEKLPTPTYGTGGILWASLTLSLLTVPVVIVASEEALAAVPRSMREASLAMGATRLQTILRVVLPAAAPGILTGLILAMARAAGEVAPLMITGVVKLAPDLPLDGSFPYFHPDRKFMHLGFHIYDVGFQSPNVEAAKPMVYTTTILLLLIVVMLNLTAILVRNRLRSRYRTSAF